MGIGIELEQLACNLLNFNSDKDNVISIIIKQIDDDQLHCGVSYKIEEEINFMHFAFHFNLIHDFFNDYYSQYLFIKSKIPYIRQLNIAAFWDVIWQNKKNNNIPYGILYEKSFFDNNAVFNLEDNECGLTCATFVLAIFKLCGYNLLDIDSWEHRDDDKIYHNKVIENLIKYKDDYNISEDHIEKVRKNIGAYRFRPEEVTASVTLTKLPATFNEVTPLGALLKTHIIQSYS